MDSVEFTLACMALFGSDDWKARARLALRVSERTFRRWLDGADEIPKGAVDELVRLLKSRREAIDRVLANWPAVAPKPA